MHVLILCAEAIPTLSLQKLFAHNGISATKVCSIEQCKLAVQSGGVRLLVVIRNGTIGQLVDLYNNHLSPLSIPCFVLSRKQCLLERVQALQAGYANYYIEPISYVKLVQDIGSQSLMPTGYSSSYSIGEMDVYPDVRSIVFEGSTFVLSRLQFGIANLLFTYQNQIFSRTHIWEQAWGCAEYTFSNTIDAHIGRLRKILPKEISSCIKTVHGIGYKFVPEGKLVRRS